MISALSKRVQKALEWELKIMVWWSQQIHLQKEIRSRSHQAGPPLTLRRCLKSLSRKVIKRIVTVMVESSLQWLQIWLSQHCATKAKSQIYPLNPYLTPQPFVFALSQWAKGVSQSCVTWRCVAKRNGYTCLKMKTSQDREKGDDIESSWRTDGKAASGAAVFEGKEFSVGRHSKSACMYAHLHVSQQCLSVKPDKHSAWTENMMHLLDHDLI